MPRFNVASLEFARRKARTLRKAAASEGITLHLTAAQKELAKLYGYASWSEMTLAVNAREKTPTDASDFVPDASALAIRLSTDDTTAIRIVQAVHPCSMPPSHPKAPTPSSREPDLSRFLVQSLVWRTVDRRRDEGTHLVVRRDDDARKLVEEIGDYRVSRDDDAEWLAWVRRDPLATIREALGRSEKTVAREDGWTISESREDLDLPIEVDDAGESLTFRIPECAWTRDGIACFRIHAEENSHALGSLDRRDRVLRVFLFSDRLEARELARRILASDRAHPGRETRLRSPVVVVDPGDEEMRQAVGNVRLGGASFIFLSDGDIREAYGRLLAGGAEHLLEDLNGLVYFVEQRSPRRDGVLHVVCTSSSQLRFHRKASSRPPSSLRALVDPYAGLGLTEHATRRLDEIVSTGMPVLVGTNLVTDDGPILKAMATRLAQSSDRTRLDPDEDFLFVEMSKECLEREFVPRLRKGRTVYGSASRNGIGDDLCGTLTTLWGMGRPSLGQQELVGNGLAILHHRNHTSICRRCRLPAEKSWIFGADRKLLDGIVSRPGFSEIRFWNPLGCAECSGTGKGHLVSTISAHVVRRDHVVINETGNYLSDPHPVPKLVQREQPEHSMGADFLRHVLQGTIDAGDSLELLSSHAGRRRRKA